MKRPHFCGISIFLHFWEFWGVFDLYFFGGTPEWVKFVVFSILPDPGCPGDPMVGPHTDCVAPWDTVGGTQVLGCPQGPRQTGFEVGGFGRFARQIWLENDENFTSWILPDPGRLGDPKAGSRCDCIVSWDIVGGIQALGGPHGPPQTGFGVAQDAPLADLAVLQGKFRKR